jgi:hypothetical protein
MALRGSPRNTKNALPGQACRLRRRHLPSSRRSQGRGCSWLKSYATRRLEILSGKRRCSSAISGTSSLGLLASSKGGEGLAPSHPRIGIIGSICRACSYAEMASSYLFPSRRALPFRIQSNGFSAGFSSIVLPNASAASSYPCQQCLNPHAKVLE